VILSNNLQTVSNTIIIMRNVKNKVLFDLRKGLRYYSSLKRVC